MYRFLAALVAAWMLLAGQAAAQTLYTCTFAADGDRFSYVLVRLDVTADGKVVDSFATWSVPVVRSGEGRFGMLVLYPDISAFSMGAPTMLLAPAMTQAAPGAKLTVEFTAPEGGPWSVEMSTEKSADADALGLASFSRAILASSEASPPLNPELMRQFPGLKTMQGRVRSGERVLVSGVFDVRAIEDRDALFAKAWAGAVAMTANPTRCGRGR